MEINSRIINETGIGTMIIFSLLLHVTVFFVIYKLARFMNPHLPESQTYYVEVSNLPVFSPQSGTKPKDRKRNSSGAPTIHHEMHLPPVPVRQSIPPEVTRVMVKEHDIEKTVQSTGKELRLCKKQQHAENYAQNIRKREKQPTDGADEEKEFTERMARLEQNAESQHESEALEALRKKSSINGRAGTPNGGGKQAGSDYAGYVQSRLRDAFGATIAYRSKNPEAAILLRISRFGKIIGWSLVKSSHDKLFEDAVARAIVISVGKFPPPPGGETFEHGYVFRPEGVGKR